MDGHKQQLRHPGKAGWEVSFPAQAKPWVFPLVFNPRPCLRLLLLPGS